MTTSPVKRNLSRGASLRTGFHLVPTILIAVLLGGASAVNAQSLFQLDFATATGEAEGWDIIDEILAEDECDYLDEEFTPCTVFDLTNQNGSSDVTLEILEVPFIGNTTSFLTDPQVYDGFDIPEEAIGDYQYRNPDTAGTSAPFRFSNLSPATYSVTVFEGRTTDGNGQFAKLWVGDANGSNEPGVMGEHTGQNTGDFAAGASTLSLAVGEGEFLWFRYLEDNSGGISGMIIREDRGGPLPVGGSGEVENRTVNGARGNLVFGEPGGPNLPGLGQSWYSVGNPGSKAPLDEIFTSNDRAVPYFHSEDGTWWAGSDIVEGVPNYPTQVDGVITGDNYSVKLDGEILIDESGPIQFLDGVDDFTYLAIDLDRSGVAGDSEGDVLINDNGWTNALSTANNGAPIVEVDFEDIAEGGEWLAIEFNMAEGGGGDSGMLYWDAMDEDDFFPLSQGEGVLEEDAIVFLVPDTHLRGPSTPAQLLSGEVSAAVPPAGSGWEFDVDPSDGTADSFGLESPDSDIFTTILDVEGIEIHINPLGEVSEGDSFQILQADSIVGTPTVATEGWNLNVETGVITFGESATMGLIGDINMNGSVDFPDFLALSGAFGGDVDPPGSGADLNGDGSVSFPDFLLLSQNFGRTAAQQAVPEPSGFALFGFAGALLMVCRNRRR